jgi:hypothetical protein
MDLRERRTGDNDPGDTTAETGGDTLDAQRESTQRMIAASERVIPQALSANSAAFIAANRQHGGE